MSQGYRPEIEGRIDILVDVAMMSRFLAAPRSGHLEELFHIFAYLKKYD
jgi:hypothetical protein